MKKKLMILIICFCLILPGMAYAMENPYFDLGYEDCTWTAWQMAHDYLGVELPAWGYARNWYSGAEADGYSVGQVAMPGSIVCWDGHVGYVYSVSGDEMYVLEGGQYTPSGYDEVWHTCNGPSLSGKPFMGYIYLAGVPGDSSAVKDVPVESSQPDTTGQDPTSQRIETVSEKVVASEEKSNASKQSGKSSAPEGSLTGEDQKSIAERQARLAEMRQQKAELNQEISQTQAEIDRLSLELKQRMDRMSVGVRVFYEFGTESYIQVLFSAEDLTDFFTRFEYLSRVIRAENTAMSEARATLKALQENELALQEQQTALDNLIG